MKSKFLLFLIILIAFILRFHQLGSNPSSIDWDEASLGYNAYSILRTGKDEYGKYLPLSIRSFNDYKPPLYTYLTVPSVALFGLTEFSVRLTSAIFGLIGVISAFLLIKELFFSEKIALLTSFFLAISPWHLQFSRIAFEANVALTLIILGVLFFVKGLNNRKKLIASSVFFGLSLYSYHSPRLIIPFLILGLIIIYFNKIRLKIYSLIVFLVIISLFYLPVLKEFSSAGARFTSVSVVNPDEKLGQSIKAIDYDASRGDWLGKLVHNRRIVFGREILGGYLNHFNFDFLFLTGDPPGRHHGSGMGMLYFVDLPFMVLGFLFLFKNIKEKQNKTIMLWYILAPLASAFTSGTPHAVRAIFYLPSYQIFTSLGIIEVFKSSKNKFHNFSKVIILFIILLFTFNFFYYLHQYYIHTPLEYASQWQYGYKEAVSIADKYGPFIDKIIVTYKYDQPYIYFLFYDKIDPSWYQKNWGDGEILRSERKFSKFDFRNIDWENDKNLHNVLLIGTPDEIPQTASGIVAEIAYPDGSIAFRIVRK